MKDEIAKYLTESSRNLLKVLSRNLFAETEESHVMI
jgi:hypothetical protein